jgi:hypothetical protein
LCPGGMGRRRRAMWMAILREGEGKKGYPSLGP